MSRERTRTSRGNKTSRSLWEDTSTELNPNAPSVRRSLAGEKWKRRVIGGLAFVAVPLSALVAVSTFASASTDTAGLDPTLTSIAANDTPGKAAAMAAVTSWLEQAPTPLPGGRLVSWDGYTVEDPPVPETQSEQQLHFTLESHRFTLQRGNALFAAAVQVAVDEVLGAKVTTTPSLTPVLEAERIDDLVPWFDLNTTSAPAPVVTAANDWARAFTSGDPGVLQRSVRDQDATRSYIPLTGVAAVRSVEVLSAAYLPEESETNPPTRMVARVALTIEWAGAPLGEKETPAPITYDVLVTDPDSASPAVVAWGAPGTGPTLAAYVNALAGVAIDIDDLATPTPAPMGVEQ